MTDKSLFVIEDGAGEFGVDQLKATLTSVFENVKLDRDGDGKVVAAEFTTALFNVVFPALAGFKGITNEVRDLTELEFIDLLKWVEANFPLQAQLSDEVELLTAKTVQLIRAGVEWFDAFQALREANKVNTETPTE